MSANVNGATSTWTLEIALNGNADSAAVSALVNAIAYENNNGSSSGTRIVDFVLEDGDGGTSNVSSVTVNVAPNMAPDSNSINEGFTEDTTAEITVSGTDSDGSVAEIRILTLPANGTLYTDAALNNAAVAGASYATTDDSLTLFFVADADFNGDTSFLFAAIDDQGLEGPSAVKSLEGTAVNDAPVLDNAGKNTLTAIDEDNFNSTGDLVSYIIGSAAGNPNPITDVDTGAVEGIAIYNADTTNGDWEYSTDGGTNWIDFGNPSATAALLLSDNALVRFVPGENFNGDATFSFLAWDQTTGTEGGTIALAGNAGGTNTLSDAIDTAFITVNPVNDAPELDNTGFASLTSIDEDNVNSAGDTIADLLASGNPNSVSDQDDDPEGIAIFNADQTNGTFQYQLEGTIQWVDFANVSESSALLLDDSTRIRFVPAPNYNGDATISYRAWDQTTGTEGDKIAVAGNSGGSNTLSTERDTATITVNPVNDAPTVTNNGGVADEGGLTMLTAAMLQANDADDSAADLEYTVSNVSNGQFENVSEPGVVVTSFTQEQVDLGQVVFVHDGSETSTATFDFSLADGGEDSAPAATGTFVFNVTPVNDAPESISSTSGGLEDTTLSIQINATDVDGAVNSFRITSLPADGTLYSDASLTNPVTVNTVLTAGPGGSLNLWFEPTPDWNGTTSFNFAATDDQGLEDSTVATQTLTVDPVNDAPMLTGGAVNDLTVNEDSGFTSLGLAGLTHSAGGGADEIFASVDLRSNGCSFACGR